MKSDELRRLNPDDCSTWPDWLRKAADAQYTNWGAPFTPATRSGEYFAMALAGSLALAEQMEQESAGASRPPAPLDGQYDDFWRDLGEIEVRQYQREWPERGRRRMQFRAWRWSRLLWAMGDYCGLAGTDNVTSVGVQRHDGGTFVGTVESTLVATGESE